MRSIAWKVGQVAGPVIVGLTMDLFTTEALRVGGRLHRVATIGFTVSARRAHAERALATDPTVSD